MEHREKEEGSPRELEIAFCGGRESAKECDNYPGGDDTGKAEFLYRGRKDEGQPIGGPAMMYTSKPPMDEVP